MNNALSRNIKRVSVVAACLVLFCSMAVCVLADGEQAVIEEAAITETESDSPAESEDENLTESEEENPAESEDENLTESEEENLTESEEENLTESEEENLTESEEENPAESEEENVIIYNTMSEEAEQAILKLENDLNFFIFQVVPALLALWFVISSCKWFSKTFVNKF